MLIGIVLLACLLGFYAYMQWNAEPRAAIIGNAWVIDGDTIEISGTRIRLEGIDAPELDQPAPIRRGRHGRAEEQPSESSKPTFAVGS